MEYEVLGSIWHTKDGVYYGSGDVCKLDHLPQRTVDYLVQVGVVKPKDKPKEEKKEQ